MMKRIVREIHLIRKPLKSDQGSKKSKARRAASFTTKIFSKYGILRTKEEGLKLVFRQNPKTLGEQAETTIVNNSLIKKYKRELNWYTKKINIQLKEISKVHNNNFQSILKTCNLDYSRRDESYIYRYVAINSNFNKSYQTKPNITSFKSPTKDLLKLEQNRTSTAIRCFIKSNFENKYLYPGNSMTELKQRTITKNIQSLSKTLKMLNAVKQGDLNNNFTLIEGLRREGKTINKLFQSDLGFGRNTFVYELKKETIFDSLKKSEFSIDNKIENYLNKNQNINEYFSKQIVSARREYIDFCEKLKTLSQKDENVLNPLVVKTILSVTSLQREIDKAIYVRLEKSRTHRLNKVEESINSKTKINKLLKQVNDYSSILMEATKLKGIKTYIFKNENLLQHQEKSYFLNNLITSETNDDAVNNLNGYENELLVLRRREEKVFPKNDFISSFSNSPGTKREEEQVSATMKRDRKNKGSIDNEEIEIIANKVFKILEKNIRVQRDRRGIL